MAQIKDGSSFLDGKKIPKSVNGQYADDNGNIQIEAFSSSEDIADNPVTFTEASERTNIQSGESTATLFGKVKKWFTDLRALAFKDTISSSDLDSSLSTTINNKVDKEEGKGLSTNDFTNEEKSKLAGIATGAEVNVQADWNETLTSSDAYILNKPTSLSDFTNDMNFVTQYWYQGYHLDNVHVQATFEWPFAVAMLIEFLIVFLGASKLMKKDKSNYVYVNYAFFAFFFTLMGTRHSILDRLSVYFEFAFPLSIPLLYTCLKESFPSWWSLFDKHPEEKENRKNAAVTAVFLAFVLCGGLAIHQYALTMDHHGVVPYRCILNQPFYQEYLENLENPQDEPAEPAEEAVPIIEEPVDTPPPETSTQLEMPTPQEENKLPEQTDIPEGMPVEVPLP